MWKDDTDESCAGTDLDGEQRTTLVRWSRGRSTPARLVLRAKITLRAADGMLNKDIARELATDVNTVGRWRRRFAEGGLDAIAKDAPRGGRKPIKRSRLAARSSRKRRPKSPRAPRTGARDAGQGTGY